MDQLGEDGGLSCPEHSWRPMAYRCARAQLLANRIVSGECRSRSPLTLTEPRI